MIERGIMGYYVLLRWYNFSVTAEHTVSCNIEDCKFLDTIAGTRLYFPDSATA